MIMEFCYLAKKEFNQYANQLFSVLYDNMNTIAPTSNSREEDFQCWLEAVEEGLRSEKRHIVIISDRDSQEVIGFFQYYTNECVFMMEEIQIMESYQGKYNIFRDLYGFVFEQIKDDICFVEAYANKQNIKSLGILEKMGLSIIGENKNGISYHLRGAYTDLMKWYNKTWGESS